MSATPTSATTMGPPLNFFAGLGGYIKYVFAGMLGLLLTTMMNILFVPVISKLLGSRWSASWSYVSTVLGLLWGANTFQTTFDPLLNPIFGAGA